MPFWSSQRIQQEQQTYTLVTPFDPNRIQQGVYELSLSREVITTANGGHSPGQEQSVLEIPSGQFALLYTEEKVTIPSHVLAFISIKASVKFEGLVNVSGFHVDPGYDGRLKFSVYNAGNRKIFLEFGEPTFLIWFTEFDQPVRDPYPGNRRLKNRITPQDRERMSDKTHSPAALAARLDTVEGRMSLHSGIFVTVLTAVALPAAIAAGIVVFEKWLDKGSDTDARRKNSSIQEFVSPSELKSTISVPPLSLEQPLNSTH